MKVTPKSKAWDAFSKYIRLRDAIKTTGTITDLICYTCGTRYPAFGKGCAQAGHFIPGRKGAVLIDEIGVHGQCYNCNHNLGGAWVEYEEHMLKDYGPEIVAKLKANKHKTLKRESWEWKEIEEEYKTKYQELLDGK